MDRRTLIATVVAALVAVVGSPASADLYPFNSSIDFTSPSNPYWNPGDDQGRGKHIKEGPGSSSKDDPFNYAHNINPLVPLGDLVIDAMLTLEFVDDDPDKNGSEYVQLAFEGGSGIPIGEVDTGVYDPPFIVNVNWLDDRILNVRVEVTNENDRGDVYLKSSTLSGNAEVASPVVPSPASVLLGFLGLTAAGLKLRKLA